jgi:hypothetical protein
MTNTLPTLPDYKRREAAFALYRAQRPGTSVDSFERLDKLTGRTYLDLVDLIAPAIIDFATERENKRAVHAAESLTFTDWAKQVEVGWDDREDLRVNFAAGGIAAGRLIKETRPTSPLPETDDGLGEAPAV